MQSSLDKFNTLLRPLTRDKFKKNFTELLYKRFGKNGARIKQFLINCILKNNRFEEFKNSQIKSQTYDFNDSPGDRILLEPGNIFMRINKNGKEMTVDLANISKWTDWTDQDKALINFMQIMNDAMKKLSENFNDPGKTKSFDNAKKLVTSMWYNIFLYTLRTNKRLEKQALLLLCIYSSLKKYNITTSKEQIHKWLGLTISLIGIDSYNTTIGEIFKGTAFETYFFGNDEFELPENIERAKELFLMQFADKGFKLNKEIELGIILYLANKFEYNEINLEFLMLKNPSVNHFFILKGFKEVQTFYKRHKELEEAIDRFKTRM